MVSCSRGQRREARTKTRGAHESTELEELFLDVHDRLYRALYFVTGISADAEELMQDAFLKLWERWDRLDTIDGWSPSGSDRRGGVGPGRLPRSLPRRLTVPSGHAALKEPDQVG